MQDNVLPLLHWPSSPWPGMDADMEAAVSIPDWVKSGISGGKFDLFVKETYATLSEGQGKSLSSSEEEFDEEEPEFKGKGKARVRRSKKVKKVEVKICLMHIQLLRTATLGLH
jgi:hypothetical protein